MSLLKSIYTPAKSKNKNIILNKNEKKNNSNAYQENHIINKDVLFT